MSENLFYFLNVCEKNGSNGLQYSKDSFSSKLFPTLKDNQKPGDFENPMKVYENIPQGFQEKLDLKNVDLKTLTKLLKIRFPIYRLNDRRLWSYKSPRNRKRPIHIVSQLTHNRL